MMVRRVRERMMMMMVVLCVVVSHGAVRMVPFTKGMSISGRRGTTGGEQSPRGRPARGPDCPGT
jgi:hypothetical protein